MIKIQAAGRTFKVNGIKEATRLLNQGDRRIHTHMFAEVYEEANTEYRFDSVSIFKVADCGMYSEHYSLADIKCRLKCRIPGRLERIEWRKENA